MLIDRGSSRVTGYLRLMRLMYRNRLCFCKFRLNMMLHVDECYFWQSKSQSILSVTVVKFLRSNCTHCCPFSFAQELQISVRTSTVTGDNFIIMSVLFCTRLKSLSPVKMSNMRCPHCHGCS